jgi:DNA polymerase-3 subunit epsilon
MLMEEFDRAGLEFDVAKRRLIDVQRIFYKMEPRTLKAALRFYCQKEMEHAHDALADVRATVDVFKGQLQHYEGRNSIDEEGKEVIEPVKNDMQVLHEFTNDMKIVDITNKLKYDHHGVIVFNFGKYMGQSVIDVLTKERHYYHWIMEKEFSVQVKQTVKRLMKEVEKKSKK